MKLSVQLYTVRDATATDVPGTLKALKAAGLEYVELAGNYGMSSVEYSALLKSIGLKPSGAHHGIEALESDLGSIVEDAKVFGIEWIIVPYVGHDRRDWPRFAADLNGVAAKLAERGLKLAYHNHDFEFGPDQGLRQLRERTDPELVYFQLDVGWAKFAGEDPAKVLGEFAGRVSLVHLKDLDPTKENIHVVAGDGFMDWDSTLKACVDAGVKFGAIEMDVPPTDPVADTIRCIHFFQERGIS